MWIAAQLQTAVGQPGQAVQQPIYIEDSPAALELSQEASELSKEGRYADAAQKLQQVIDTYPHKLMPTADASYTDALLWARGELLADAQLLKAYRSLFDPAAERETSQAMPTNDHAIDAEALRGVLSRYTLTRAGLDAGLALCAYHLERAEGGDATGVLDELATHPDLPTLAGRYHLMRGVASLLTGDTPGYEAQRQALRDLSDTSHLAELEALTNRIHPPLRLQHKPENGETQPGLPERLDAPLWQIDLMESVWQNVTQRQDIRNLPADQAVLRVLPVCDRDRLFINLVDEVVAYGRASGWRLWQVAEQPDAPTSARMIMAGRGIIIEPRGVYLQGGRAYTLLGWVHPNPNVRAVTERGVALVALRSDDGKQLWRITPGDIDPTLGNADFDGTPTGADGRIYTLVKRVRGSGLYDLYLTAVRQDDGARVWRRHLSSSATQTNYNIGPTVRMTTHAGRVYVCDNRGAVVALDGRTGTVRWINILPSTTTIKPTTRRVIRAVKDAPDPLLVQAGLLVPPTDDGGDYLLFDPDTGELLRELRDRGWRGVEACYAAGPNIFAVGNDVLCFDGRTLELIWRMPLDTERVGRARGRPAVNVQPSGGLVVFNTDSRLFALNLDSGAVLSDTPIDSPGNIELAPGQVIVAAMADLNAYTDWHVAHRHLQDLADQSPTDPRPGLALARLAMRTARDDAVLEGIDLALGTLTADLPDPDAQTARQREVFGLIRDFTDPVNGAGVTLRGELLDRMAVSTSNPGQEATYQLTRGQYLVETGEPQRAVEHYQAILTDRTLAAELYTVGRGSRRAELEARRRLQDLIQTHGREVYQTYDLIAEQELSELTLRLEPDARPYTELADRYPLALCVNEVRQSAADRSLEAGDITSALRQLQAIYLGTISDDGVPLIAGRIVQIYLANDRPELARRWLRRVEREHPGLILIREDQPVHVQSWLSELQHILSTSRRLPQIDLPLQSPQWISGRPMPSDPDVINTGPPSDRVLMTDGQSAWMLSTPGMDELWRVPLPAADARVLVMDERQIVWWSIQTQQIGALDSRNGDTLWETIDYQDALDNAGDPRLQLERRTLQQQQFVQILGGAAVRNPRLNPGLASRDGLLKAVDLTTIMLADRLGRAICIDRDTGQIRWRTLGPADSLTSIALGDGLVAMGGASWADTAAQHGIVALLDTLTGEPLETVIQSEKVATWLGFADNGLLITALPGNLTSYDPATGRTEWRRDLPTMPGANRFDLGGRLLIVSQQQVQASSALVIDTDTGEPVNQLPIRAVSNRPMLFDAFEADGQWYVLTPMRAVALNTSGTTRWSDAICAPVGHIQMQHIGQRHTLIIGGAGPTQVLNLPPIQLQGRPEIEQAMKQAIEAAHQQNMSLGYRLYMLDRVTGSIISDLPLDDVEAPIEPDAATLIDGALLLGSGNQTLVIKGQIPPD